MVIWYIKRKCVTIILCHLTYSFSFLLIQKKFGIQPKSKIASVMSVSANEDCTLCPSLDNSNRWDVSIKDDMIKVLSITTVSHQNYRSVPKISNLKMDMTSGNTKNKKAIIESINHSRHD